MNVSPLYHTDSYKHTHVDMFLPNTTKTFSHCTPRFDRYLKRVVPDISSKYVVFGVQYVIEKLDELWSQEFFNQDLETALLPLEDIRKHFGWTFDQYQEARQRFTQLYQLGHLPVEIKAVAEGSVVDINVPIFTITNTNDNFPWLTNFLESYLLSEIFVPVTVATLCRHIHFTTKSYYDKASDITKDFAQHCFSYRGHQNTEVSAVVGMAYALFNSGSDTIASIPYMRKYYNQKDVNVFSINASEHSVQTLNIRYMEKLLTALYADCSVDKMETFVKALTDIGMNTQHFDSIRKILLTSLSVADKAELLALLRLMSLYPNSPLAIVSDSFDFWAFMTNLKYVKNDILDRPSTAPIIFRPDSGDPVDVLLGTGSSFCDTTAECIGMLEHFKQLFGTKTNSKGFEVLSPQVRIVYGDGINYERLKTIYKNMTEDLGMSPENVCLALGAYFLGNVTRDSLGFALKASYNEVNGERIDVNKSPKTDSSKKSFKGDLAVILVDGVYHVIENPSTDVKTVDKLETVYVDGKSLLEVTFENLRKILN